MCKNLLHPLIVKCLIVPMQNLSLSVWNVLACFDWQREFLFIFCEDEDFFVQFSYVY